MLATVIREFRFSGQTLSAGVTIDASEALIKDWVAQGLVQVIGGDNKRVNKSDQERHNVNASKSRMV